LPPLPHRFATTPLHPPSLRRIRHHSAVSPPLPHHCRFTTIRRIHHRFATVRRIHHCFPTDARYRPKISMNLISNKEKFGFLIHMLLIKTLVFHMSLEKFMYAGI
jgi:hypothetical protein